MSGYMTFYCTTTHSEANPVQFWGLDKKKKDSCYTFLQLTILELMTEIRSGAWYTIPAMI
jgi:hypothetical protein